MSNYEVARIDEIDELHDERLPYHRPAPSRDHGVRGHRVEGREAGDRIINEHDEAGSDEELYLVQEGHAVFELDGERVDAPAGTLVFARPAATRTAFAVEPGTTIVAFGASPGKPYEPNGWELWAPYGARYERGEYAEVADRLRDVVDANP
jgi:hypothetical protein